MRVCGGDREHTQGSDGQVTTGRIMKTAYERIQEAAKAVRKKTDIVPKIGVVLGTGLGNFTQMVMVDSVIPYADIPHFVP